MQEETVDLSSTTDAAPRITISCPDATGLGVDICRVFLDFGVTITSADISTDGLWAYLVFKVTVTPGFSQQWPLLKICLQSLCPKDGLPASQPWRIPPPPPPPFLLVVDGYNREGLLHQLIQVIWDLDLSVFKAKISTSATGQVEDKFWIIDNTHGLPMLSREREIRGTISAIIGPGAECTVIPVEKELTSSRSAMLLMNESQIIGSACGLRRPCKDSASHSNLRFLTNKYNTNSINNNSGNLHYYTSSSSVGGSSRGSSYHGGSQHGGSVDLIGGAGGIACIDENNNNEAEPKEEEEKDAFHYHHHHHHPPADLHKQSSSNEHTLSSTNPSSQSSEAASDDHEDRFYHDLSDNIINNNNNTNSSTVFLSNCAYNTGYTGAEVIAAAADSAVEVLVENDTSASFTLLTLRCNDRKGLLYDIMRSLKDMDVRIGFGRLEAVLQDNDTTGNRMVEADLFVQDAQSGKILEETMLKILVDRVHVAITRPYQLMISIKKKQHRKGKSAGTEIATPLHNNSTAATNNKSTDDLLEVTVITELDAGGRGRPRVTYDVTRGLDQAQFGVVSAEIYVNEIEHGRRDTYCHGVEVHQFLVESLHDYEAAAGGGGGKDMKQGHVKCTYTVNNKKNEEEVQLMMMNKKIASLQSAIKGQLLGNDNRDSMYSYNERKKSRVE